MELSSVKGANILFSTGTGPRLVSWSFTDEDEYVVDDEATKIDYQNFPNLKFPTETKAQRLSDHHL